jgi:DNA repair protein RadA/Sms
MKLNRLNELEARNDELTNLINSKERQGLDCYNEKKEFYENKLEMIELITVSDKRNAISASELIQRVKDRPPAVKYATGIDPLDYQLHGGFAQGSLVILGGGSFVGKTHITLEVLTNVASYNKAVFFNFEMSDTRIADRLERMSLSTTQLNNLEIDEDSRWLKEIEVEITLHAKKGIKFFVIDSKMKIDVEGHGSMNEKSSMVTKTLSKLAQKHDVIILLINQISEENLKHGYFGFKGSGDQLYDADYALFYTKDEKGNRTMTCIKNRVDEKEFSIQLKLQGHKTVSASEVEISYENVSMTKI